MCAWVCRCGKTKPEADGERNNSNKMEKDLRESLTALCFQNECKPVIL